MLAILLQGGHYELPTAALLVHVDRLVGDLSAPLPT
jgi:hypothetical protein